MLNSKPLNTEPLNSSISVLATGVGTIISITQQVANIGSGTIISIEQSVSLYHIGSGTLVSFEQIVKSLFSGTVISISQNVQNPNANTYFNRNHYDVDIYIGGYQIPKSQICSMVTIRKKENTSVECKFSIYPGPGVQSPETYQGQAVIVNLTNSSGVVYRNFTGYIDTPSMDIIEKKIEFTCTDRRDSRILSLPYSYIQSIGLFSTDVFGDPKDQADELSKRLMTTPVAFDFDNYGNPQITPWLPKGTADIVLSGSSMYYDKPEVIYSNRTKTINTVNIEINYKHQRLHEQLAFVSWAGYGDFMTDWFNVGKPTFPKRTTITSAAQSQSWSPVSKITFTDLWPKGGYGSGINTVAWNPDTTTNTYAPVQVTTDLPYEDPTTHVISTIWPDGKKHQTTSNVLDAAGNIQYYLQLITTTYTSLPLCRGAYWTAGKKFAQNVTELYTLKFTSPQAVSRFGTIESHETININDPYDTSIWTNDKQLYAASTQPSTAVGAQTTSAAYSKGDTVLALAGVGSGSITVNSVITLTGDPSGSYYTVQAGVSNVGSGGFITLKAPGLMADLFAQEYPIVPAPQSLSATSNFFIDQKPLYSHLALALQVACAKAETSIKGAHRDVYVKFRRRIWPEADLTHTIQTTATQVASKGKISSLSHTIDVSTGEAYTDVELQLSRSFGGDSQSSYNITVPPYEDNSYIGEPAVVTLGTHYGVDPDLAVTPTAISWNGYIGNSTNVVTQGQNYFSQRTVFPESFTVDYPPIVPIKTQNRTITASLPGHSSGMTTNSAGYLAGVTSITLAAAGTGSLLQGDTVQFTGDSSGGVYTVQSDILNVSVGGVLTISPGLGAALSATAHAITYASPANNFVVAIPNDSLTVTFL